MCPCAAWGCSASSNSSPGQCFKNSTCSVPGQGGNAPLEWAGISESPGPRWREKRRSEDKRKKKTLGHNPLGKLCLPDHCCHLF